MNDKGICAEEFAKLLDIMNDLREKCPWDRKQTNETLYRLTIEETYELADAILSKDDDAIKGELGDLLLHIVFYAKIGEEKKAFNMTDVIRHLCKKLIYRHPHVYGNVQAADEKEVRENWEALKIHEKGTAYKPVLSGVPKSLPATVKANRIQEKAGGIGFDWEKPEQVWDKVKEEYGELMTEIENNRHDRMEEEFGDLFFALVNAARLYNIDPEIALERTNRKFIKRFNYMEEQTLAKGLSLHNMTLEEMDRYWQQAKEQESETDAVE